VTEDDNHGGLEKVLAQVLDEFGLPPECGLTGLLRHMQGNRLLTETLLHQHLELLQNRISAFMAAVQKMKEDGTIVDLFMVADMLGEAAGTPDEAEDLVAGWPGAMPRRAPAYETVELPDGPQRSSVNDTTLSSFVTGVKESFPQYDEDHRHVPKPEQKEDHDGDR